MLTFCVVVVYGGLLLVDSTRSGSGAFKAGSYVLLMKIAREFGKDTTRVNAGFVRLQRAAVSITSVKRVLDQQECLLRTSSRTSESLSQLVDPQRRLLQNNCIELNAVRYIAPADIHGTDPMDTFCMKPGQTAVVPLHRVVRVTGLSEGSRMTFMALLARVLQPTSGQVLIPMDAWAVMLPPVPFSQPNLSVHQSLEDIGAPESIVDAIACALDLDPKAQLNRLPPGELQILAIARALLRDPAMLVLVRPLAFVAPQRRRRAHLLLRAWQAGGSKRLVHWLMGTPAPETCTCMNTEGERT
eukprot:TRINITY_DN13784_c0_g1_i2.p1 TRINITY_DN13784_c0_g1~~TRINITY_DN13784_c0_g1_i2.p1  ORF type:complete len:300 (-),score=9.16 TRINITY_DN13784_c0_g1_i2:31-930(-)